MDALELFLKVVLSTCLFGYFILALVVLLSWLGAPKEKDNNGINNQN